MTAATRDIHTARTHLFVPVTVGFAVLAAVCATGVPIPLWLQLLPFAASLVVLGLPHGAADHLVPAWLDRRRQSVGSILRVVCVYGVLIVVTLSLWAWSPTAAAIGFVILTWFHWGQGDLYVLLAVNDSRYLHSRWLRSVAVAVRGGLPMIVPLLFHPDTFRGVLDSTARLFDPAASTSTLLTAGSTRAALGVAVVSLIAAASIVTWRRAVSPDDRAAWRRDQIEVAVLFVFFAAAPPILAVGLYFSMWHALRHFVRLDAIADAPPDHRIATMVRACAPTTAVAVAALAVVALVVPNTVGTSEAALALYLVVISTLTVPHVAVVSYMDARQHVWSRGPTAVR